MKYLLALVVCLLSFTGTAVAASAAVSVADSASDGSILDGLKSVLDAVHNGQGWLAAALALTLLVTGLRQFGAALGKDGKPRWPWLSGDIGGALTTVLASAAGMAATSIAAGTLPSAGLLLTSLKVAVFAAGGYTLIKKLAAPFLRWAQGKLPVWAQPLVTPLLDLVLWAFESKTAVADAKAAGQAAVNANPPKGPEGVVGKPKDLP